MSPKIRDTPPKQKRAFLVQRQGSSVGELIDKGFFIFAGLATLWLGVLLFVAGWGLDVQYWVYFIGFWVIVAYLALPRLHRILSQIYVPSYFIGRTRTSDGLLGDPVNLAFRGTEAQLHAAMQAAGWHLADETTVYTTWKIISSTLRRRSYRTAPVSPLLLFGRVQDFAYQQEVNGSPLQRHHVRFWHCPKGWLLPGGHQVDWLAAGTFDTSVGLSFFTLQVTHRIDENTDIERDYIVRSLKKANQKVKVATIKDFSTGYHSRNGGGDTIITDGDLPVVEVELVPATKVVESRRPGLILDSTAYEPGHEPLTPTLELGEAVWYRRPVQLVIGAILVAVIMMMELFQSGQVLYREVAQAIESGVPFEDVSYLIVAVAIAGLVYALVEVVLMVYVLKGSGVARLLLLMLAAGVIIQKGIEYFVQHQPITFGNSLINVSLHIGVLLALSSDEARRFSYSSNRSKRIE